MKFTDDSIECPKCGQQIKQVIGDEDSDTENPATVWTCPACSGRFSFEEAAQKFMDEKTRDFVRRLRQMGVKVTE